MTDPESSPEEWINFYCDEEFYKANSKIYALNMKNSKSTKKTEGLIVKYVPHFEGEHQYKPIKEKKPELDS